MEYRSIVTQLRREELKRKQGNNKIHDSWVKAQIKAKPELKKYYALIAKGQARLRITMVDCWTALARLGTGKAMQ